MVFEKEKYHTLYHCGAELIENGDGTYKTFEEPEREFVLSNKSYSGKLYKCKMCGKYLVADKRKDFCVCCGQRNRAIINGKPIMPNKEVLLGSILDSIRIDYSKLSRDYGVSDSTARNWCIKQGFVKEDGYFLKNFLINNT